MYKFELKANEGIFMITMSGMISKDEGSRFLADLKAELRGFNTEEYYLVIDTEELKASGQDSLDNMVRTIELLGNTPFGERFNIEPKSIITNTQARRIAKKDIFDKIIKVKSYSEVLSAISC